MIRDNVELTPLQRQIIIIGIVSGLKYLHDNKYLHVCLCPEAIWLDKSLYPKIFSIDQLLYPDKKTNVKYQAPELLFDENEIATEESDIFSFSRLLYYLITGSEPFSLKEDKLRNAKDFYMISKIRDGAIPFIPDYVSEPLRDLLKRCWRDAIFFICRSDLS